MIGIEHNTVPMADPETIQRLLDDPNVPTLPSVALRVLDQVSRPECDINAVTEIIKQDPALCGLMLKTLNSALYTFSRPVSSVDKALVMLGLTRVRSLILTMYMFALGRSTPVSPILKDFWKSSVVGATVTKELAVLCGRRDPESDLLSALMRDLGQIVLIQSYEDYPQVFERANGQHNYELCLLETDAYGLSHAEVSAELLKRWRLPESMTLAVAYHHNPMGLVNANQDTQERVTLLAFTSLLTEFLFNPEVNGLREQVFQEANEIFGIDEKRLIEILVPLGQKAHKMAELMNLDIGPIHNCMDVLMAANKELVRLTIQSNLEILQVQQSKQKAQEEAANWKEKATRDLLTGLYNRAYFLDRLSFVLEEAEQRCNTVGLLFIDLDGFKPINDTFGHDAGDITLREVANELRQNLRDTDIVARFGGDEFCILLPDTSTEGVRIVGERIIELLNALPLEFDGKQCRIGASVGAAYCTPWIETCSSDAFLKMADEAMYEAKKGGKNRVVVRPDQSLKKKFEEQSFQTFLNRHENISVDVNRRGYTRRPTRLCLQRLARRLQWITREQAIELTHLQRKEKYTFARAVLEKGILTKDELIMLVNLRQEPPEPLAKTLVREGRLSEGDALMALASYYRFLENQRGNTITPAFEIPTQTTQDTK
ncbi:MAG: GGDEF domain-containing protein [Gemmataceae bacterium]|nr:GGDEF domain-containing protein [Gemmataceae bacterium]